MKVLQHALSRYVYNLSLFDIFTSKKVFCCLLWSKFPMQKHDNWAIEHFFRVYSWASSKHREGWENSRQLRKQETSSRICITFENSPSPSNVYTEKHRTVQFRPCFENVRNYTFGFFWKAVLPRHKLKLCFPKLNCRWSNPWTIQQLVNCACFKVLVKFKLKPWEIFSVENSKIKQADWQIKKQINAQVKLHFENDTF